jgi:nucleotide-binding universal stress UspA family protein
MHVVVATDGSRESLVAARYLTSFADPDKITGIMVVAVVRPLASVAFANDLSPREKKAAGTETGSFREAANDAVGIVADELRGWGPKVKTKVRSGSPASEILKEAELTRAGLVVVSAGGRGLTDTVLVGDDDRVVQGEAVLDGIVKHTLRLVGRKHVFGVGIDLYSRNQRAEYQHEEPRENVDRLRPARGKSNQCGLHQRLSLRRSAPSILSTVFSK